MFAPLALAQEPAERSAGHYPVPLAIDAANPAANVSAPAAQRATLTETFEGAVFPPAGWTRFEVRVSDTQRWTLSSEGGNQFAYSRFGDFGAGLLEDWLVTPFLSVTADENTLSFDMAQEYPELWGSTYIVAVSTVSPDDPTDFVELASWSETEGPEGQAAPPLISNGLTTYTLDLSAYIGQDVYIAFVHENDYGDSFILDNVSAPGTFQASSPPQCVASVSPSDGATDVPAESLVLSWIPASGGDPPSGYLLSVGTDPAATNIADGFDVGNNTSFELANANPGTTYFYRVEPYNSAGTSVGCQTTSFTTLAATAVFPYTQDFGSGVTCDLPERWSLERNATSQEPWLFQKTIQYGAAQDHTTGSGCFATVDDSSPNNAPTSLLSPYFDFSSLTSPEVSFWIQNRRIGSSGPFIFSQLFVDVSTDGGSTYTNGVGTATGQYGTWTKIVVDLSAYAGEPNVRLRFRAVEASGSFAFLSDISLDDVVVGQNANGAVLVISPGSTGSFSFDKGTPCVSQERTFTITNAGTSQSSLDISAITLTGDAAFSILDITPTVPASLGEDESVAVRVQFTPTAAGSQSATLSIAYTLDGGAAQTFDVALSGEGDALGENSGEGEGYVWSNSTACSSPVTAVEQIDFGIAAGDTQILTWDQGSGNDGFFALDLSSTIGSFRFYGEDYDTAYINSNGYVFFDAGSILPGPPFPATTSFENAYIAALGDDLDPSQAGAVFYRGRNTDADPADDELVITYFRVPRFNFPDEFATFQVILRPGDTAGANGTVKIQYLAGSSPDDGQPLSDGFDNPNSFNKEARVGITGDQGFASVLYRDSGVGGALFGESSLALEFAPRIERIVGADAPSQQEGWRMLSAPTAGMTVAHLAEQNLVQALPDEYPVDANGNPAAPNLYTSYSGDTGFQIPSGLDDVLVPGTGFIWYFFNIDYDPEVDANIFTGDSQSYPLPAPIVAAGTSQEGNVTTPLTSVAASGGLKWELLGNPFASELDISTIGSWTTGDLASTVGQVWDPATQSYVPTSTLGDTLAVWQGAFFENDTATEITYPIAEAARFVDEARETPAQSGIAQRDAARLLRFELSGEATASGGPTLDRAIVVEFSDAGTDTWDLRDAAKLVPLTGAYATAAFEGPRGGETQLKAQESRPLTPQPFEVPVHIEAEGVTGDLALTWTMDQSLLDWTFTLVDLETSERIDLLKEARYTFQVASERNVVVSTPLAEASAPIAEQPPFAVAMRGGAEARFLLVVVPADLSTEGESSSTLPTALDLGNPYPNPFLDAASVRYALPEATRVTLTVHDVLGRRVAVLIDEQVPAGYHEATWQPRNVPDGTYFIRMDAGLHRIVRKVTFMN